MSAAADEAVAYLLRRITDDPRVAWYFGHTEALARLTKAHALATGIDPESFHRDFSASLLTERPRCRSGECYVRAESEAFERAASENGA